MIDYIIFGYELSNVRPVDSFLKIVVQEHRDIADVVSALCSDFTKQAFASCAFPAWRQISRSIPGIKC